MELHFTEYFQVVPEVLHDYGAFDISVASDLPLFIDPFLIFNNPKREYQELHRQILQYLVYLRDRAQSTDDPDTIANLYQFREIKQNWLGFTLLGNHGHGLGRKFAHALHASLRGPLASFGAETVTRSSHLEKLTLIRGGVGRDNISDFATNLIKSFLCEYTERFARQHLAPRQRQEFSVGRALFNYSTETWETRRYTLPNLRGDFVLLTPYDILTRDETWINHPDMVSRFPHLVAAIPDPQLRGQMNHYFRQHLARNPSKKQRDAAAAATINRYPELIDHYIRRQEDNGEEAVHISGKRVSETDAVFVRQLKALLADLERSTDFFDRPSSSYAEALDRAKFFKHYIEQRGGYKLITKDGQPFSNEKDVQLFFGLAWFGTEFDLSREPETGRGPVDFKASKGRIDKTLIEFKLASNTQLKRNLQNQIAIYENAEQTDKSVKVIVCYTAKDRRRLDRVLRELDMADEESLIVIDARSDNKPSASRS